MAVSSQIIATLAASGGKTWAATVPYRSSATLGETGKRYLLIRGTEMSVESGPVLITNSYTTSVAVFVAIELAN